MRDEKTINDCLKKFGVSEEEHLHNCISSVVRGQLTADGKIDIIYYGKPTVVFISVPTPLGTFILPEPEIHYNVFRIIEDDQDFLSAVREHANKLYKSNA